MPGLARPLEGPARAIIEALNAGRHDVVAVDVPSGLDGNTGAVLGVGAAGARDGHLLPPQARPCPDAGTALCGELVVAEIGIPATVLEAIAPRTSVNGAGRYGARRFPGRGPKDTNTSAAICWSPAARP